MPGPSDRPTPSPDLPRPGDLSQDGGGQRTEVGRPYDGEGGVRRGKEAEQHRDREPPIRKAGIDKK